MVTGRAEVVCPFCKKIGVRAFEKPSYLQGRTSRISSGAKITYHRVPPSITFVGSCPNCGKSAKEIQNYYDGKGPRLSHEERLKRIREAGLPTVIEEQPSRTSD